MFNPLTRGGMNIHRGIVVCALANFVVASFSAETLVFTEPAYEAKGLSYWLREYETGMPGLHKKGDPRKVARAEQAVRKIGTNGLPWLVQELNAKEKIQGDALPTNFYSGEAIGRRFLALHAFPILGLSAKDATPRLVELLDDKQTSYTAALALEGIGVESIPVLTRALGNKNACARESAARVLGMFGTNAHSSVSALVQCAKDQDGSVRGFATFSLGQIRKEPDVVVPVLAANLRDRNPSTRINAVYALGKFGSEAKSAIPDLLKALDENGNDADFKERAAEMLERIEPGITAGRNAK